MKYKDYDLIPNLRDQLKPDWKEMLNPAKPRNIITDPFIQIPLLTKSESELAEFGISLVGKDILEVGCAYGERSFLMAKYEGTRVCGIDVDEYTVNQSPDLNEWNPEDIKFIHNKLDVVRLELSKKFPMSVCNKCTFKTCGIENYVADKPHDLIISWDTLEHILDLPIAFEVMNRSVKKGGIVFHEFNPFFSLNGGHSLCTLDFYYGHCILTDSEFEEYIKEFRPNEEKIALNFYRKCLNRATLKDIKDYAKFYGFEILKLDGHNPFNSPEHLVIEELKRDILPKVVKLYPNVVIEDLLWDSVHIILRKI